MGILAAFPVICMHKLFFLLLLLGLIIGSIFAIEYRDPIVYDVPEFSVQNPNFTIGSLLPITGKDGRIKSNSILEGVAMSCQMATFNQGLGPFPLNATLNLLGYDSTEDTAVAQASAVYLLRYSLTELSKDANGSVVALSLSPDPYISMGVILSGVNVESFVVSSAIFADFKYLYLGIDYLGYGVGFNRTDVKIHRVPRVVPQPYVISLAATFQMAKAVVSMMKAFNWNLVTVLYGGHAFGAEGQSSLQKLFEALGILTVCSDILIENAAESVLSRMSNCLNNNDSRVVLLWIAADEVISNTAQYLQSYSSVGNLVFIAPGVTEIQTASGVLSNEIMSKFPMSFIFGSAVVLTPGPAFIECMRTANPAKQTYFQQNQFNEFWQSHFDCTIEAGNLPKCSESIQGRRGPCACTGTEAIAINDLVLVSRDFIGNLFLCK